MSSESPLTGQSLSSKSQNIHTLLALPTKLRGASSTAQGPILLLVRYRSVFPPCEKACPKLCAKWTKKKRKRSSRYSRFSIFWRRPRLRTVICGEVGDHLSLTGQRFKKSLASLSNRRQSMRQSSSLMPIAFLQVRKQG